MGYSIDWPEDYSPECMPNSPHIWDILQIDKKGEVMRRGDVIGYVDPRRIGHEDYVELISIEGDPIGHVYGIVLPDD